MQNTYSVLYEGLSHFEPLEPGDIVTYIVANKQYIPDCTVVRVDEDGAVEFTYWVVNDEEFGDGDGWTSKGTTAMLALWTDSQAPLQMDHVRTVPVSMPQRTQPCTPSRRGAANVYAPCMACATPQRCQSSRRGRE